MTTNRQIDQALVDRFQSGDSKAFGILVSKYEPRVQRLLFRLVRNLADAEDLAQETFIKVYHSLPSFRGDSAFYTWLYRIGTNTAKSWFAARDRRPPSSTAFSCEDAEWFDDGSLLQNIDTPERLLMAKQLAATIDKALDALPEAWRSAITLREIEGKSYQEISTSQKCPLGTVRSRISRARDSISLELRPVLDTNANGRW